MSANIELPEVSTFTAGAVGRPGQRTFYLQVVAVSGSLWFKLEKQQVSALGEHLRRMMADLPQPVVAPDAPFSAPPSAEDATFVIGVMGAGYEADRDRVVMLLEELVPVDEEGEIEPETAADQGRVRLHLTRDQVMAFVAAAEAAVANGRPSCRWCGFPMDPDGHHCPRMN